MMIPRPPTRAGESESCKTSDEVMRRARTIALAPAVRDSRVRMAGFGRPVVPDVKTTNAVPSGRGSEMESAWDLRASCSAEVSLGETRTAGMCASQWARMSTRPFRSGFGMRKAGRPGAGCKSEAVRSETRRASSAHVMRREASTTAVRSGAESARAATLMEGPAPVVGEGMSASG